MTSSTDWVSSGSHFLTAVWAVFATLVLLRMTRGHGAGRLAVGCFGLSMVLLYAASGTFHGLLALATAGDPAVREEAVRALWVAQKVDKSAVFLLIAGSCVPIYSYLLRGWLRPVCLGLTGGIAAVGIGSLWLLPAPRHEVLVGVYVGMGLVALLPARPLLRRVGWRGAVWVAGMVAAYVLGAAAEVLRWPTLVPGLVGPHEVLHLADVAGTLVHFGFVVKFVIRRPPLADRPDAPVRGYAVGPVLAAGVGHRLLHPRPAGK